MTNKKLTLLELHLSDGAVRIGPTTFGGDDSSDATTDADGDAEDDDGGCPGRTVAKLLLAVVGLVALAAVASKLLGADEDLDELEELEDLE